MNFSRLQFVREYLHKNMELTKSVIFADKMKIDIFESDNSVGGELMKR